MAVPSPTRRLSSWRLLALVPLAVIAMSTPVGAVFPILSLPELGVLQQPIGDRDAGDRFGEAVAVAGVRVIVGAPGDDEAGLDAGAAYAFVRESPII